MAEAEQERLTALVRAASETSEARGRLTAVDALRKTVLRQRDAHLLCDLATADADPAARASAAQVLGFHGAAGRFPEVQRNLAEHLRKEPDLIAAKSIAFALSGTEGAWVCVDDARPQVRAEGVLGVPLAGGAEWHRVLAAYFAGLPKEAGAVLVRRCGRGRDVPAHTVAFLLTAEFPQTEEDPAARAAALFREMDQGAVYAALSQPDGDLPRTSREIWPGLVRRERRQVLLDILADRVREAGASPSLLQALVREALTADRGDASPGRRMNGLLAALDEKAGRQLTAEIRAAGDSADTRGLRELSDLLARLIRQLPAVADACEALLAEWEEILPGMRLKAFHAKLAAG